MAFTEIFTENFSRFFPVSQNKSAEGKRQQRDLDMKAERELTEQCCSQGHMQEVLYRHYFRG